MTKPNKNEAANELATVVLKQYGFVPLTVRYEAAQAAIDVVESWRSDVAH